MQNKCTCIHIFDFSESYEEKIYVNIEQFLSSRLERNVV